MVNGVTSLVNPRGQIKKIEAMSFVFKYLFALSQLEILYRFSHEKIILEILNTQVSLLAFLPKNLAQVAK